MRYLLVMAGAIALFTAVNITPVSAAETAHQTTASPCQVQRPGVHMT